MIKVLAQSSPVMKTLSQRIANAKMQKIAEDKEDYEAGVEKITEDAEEEASLTRPWSQRGSSSSRGEALIPVGAKPPGRVKKEDVPFHGSILVEETRLKLRVNADRRWHLKQKKQKIEEHLLKIDQEIAQEAEDEEVHRLMLQEVQEEEGEEDEEGEEAKAVEDAEGNGEDDEENEEREQQQGLLDSPLSSSYDPDAEGHYDADVEVEERDHDTDEEERNREAKTEKSWAAKWYAIQRDGGEVAGIIPKPYTPCRFYFKAHHGCRTSDTCEFSHSQTFNGRPYAQLLEALTWDRKQSPGRVPMPPPMPPPPMRPEDATEEAMPKRCKREDRSRTARRSRSRSRSRSHEGQISQRISQYVKQARIMKNLMAP